jgi:hypothetical protein
MPQSVIDFLSSFQITNTPPRIGSPRFILLALLVVCGRAVALNRLRLWWGRRRLPTSTKR